MNRYVILGILFVVVGTFLMTQIVTDERLIILGVILNGFGILFMTKGSSIGSNMAKEEIIDGINHFRQEIQAVKQKTAEGESLQKIDALENEFNEWAADFLMNFEARQVAKKKSAILLNEKEIQLSKQWKHIYEYLLNTIQNMVLAYNEKSESRIEFNLPAIPINLFNKEAESYRGWLIFDDNNAWVITLQIVRPYNRDEIPNVVINFVSSN